MLLGSAKGKGETKEQNEYFSTALICTIILAVVYWGAVLFFDTEMLTLFGAEETLLPLAQEYLVAIKFVIPAFYVSIVQHQPDINFPVTLLLPYFFAKPYIKHF